MLVVDASLVRTEARGSVRDGWTAARMEARGRAMGGREERIHRRRRRRGRRCGLARMDPPQRAVAGEMEGGARGWGRTGGGGVLQWRRRIWRGEE